MSEWKVQFDTNFWGSVREEDPAFEAGTEMERPLPTIEHPINQTLVWCGEIWKILSCYTCEKGLVIDYCKQTDPTELAAFTEKFRAAGLEENFSEELFERLQLENPTAPNVELRLSRGDVELYSQGSSCVHFMPINPDTDMPSDSESNSREEENDPIALACMEHYRLDECFAYSISRAHFFWDEGHVEDLSGLTATFFERDVQVPGEHFTLTGKKQDIPLVHPVSGETYMLHIDHIEAGELSEEHLSGLNGVRAGDESEMLYPLHYEVVYYATDPELDGDKFFLKSVVRGDSPIAKENSKKVASSVSVIGGSCGPTSIFIMGKAKCELRLRSVCSPLFFEPTPVREWYVNYRVKRREDMHVDL